MAWDELPLPVDESTIITAILEGLQVRLPGWVPTEGAPEVALAEEIGLQLAQVNVAARAAADYAAAGVASAFGFEPVEGLKAVLPAVTLTAQLPPSASTVAFQRAVTVPAGFTIAVEQLAYNVPTQITRVVSFEQVTAGDFAGYWRGDLAVDFTALEVGDAWNTGTAGTVASIQTVSPVVTGAVLSGPASGGEDAETLPEFLSRFTGWLSTLRPGGVRAADIALFASTIPGVHRALALDRYDPADPGTPAERTVTVIPLDQAGQNLTAPVRATLAAELEQIREVGFIFHIIDPVRTPVTVDVEVTAAAGSESDEVAAAVQAAVEAALSPARWGAPATDSSTWVEVGVLRTLDIAVAIAQVENVASIGSVLVNGGVADVTLPGPGALPDATVSAVAS